MTHLRVLETALWQPLDSEAQRHCVIQARCVNSLLSRSSFIPLAVSAPAFQDTPAKAPRFVGWHKPVFRQGI
jgi:hypothetical protein